MCGTSLPPLESVVILDGYISDAEWGERSS